MFVRWESQAVDADHDPRLPGFTEDVVVRRFDAPEALDTRFHEVRTKSAINRVPTVSRVPFEWTVNPYRGCSHACRTAKRRHARSSWRTDRTARSAICSAGDAIYGTSPARQLPPLRRGPTVLAHWSTVKPAYRVTLADGTELVASGDHRFLTASRLEARDRRGAGAVRGDRTSPSNNALLGTGAFAAAPDCDARATADGYLCGMVRGDGASRTRSPTTRPRAARTRSLIASAWPSPTARRSTARGISCTRSASTTRVERFSAATATRREIDVDRDGQLPTAVERIREIIQWPRDPSDNWRKGFLAGIFDAEGSCSDHALRISNADETIIDWISSCARALRVRLRGRADLARTASRACDFAVVCVRATSLLPQDRPGDHPKAGPRRVARSRRDADLACRSRSSRSRASCELFDITTGTGDFIANGVVSHNCFARPTHEYLDFDAGRDFEKEIVVKVNVPEVLRAELARPSWKRRAHRDGHEHRPVPVGRGPLQADARDLGGDARLREPVLDPHEVAAAAARQGPAAARSPSARR